MANNWVITKDGTAALSISEYDQLKLMLDSGDRTGFDMAYYAMTGTDAVVLEAKISSFSGAVGGVAFGANRLQQAWHGPGTGSTPEYLGVYYLSQQVAIEGLATIKASVDVSGSGLIGSPEGGNAVTVYSFSDLHRRPPPQAITASRHGRVSLSFTDRMSGTSAPEGPSAVAAGGAQRNP